MRVEINILYINVYSDDAKLKIHIMEEGVRTCRTFYSTYIIYGVGALNPIDNLGFIRFEI